MSKSCLAVLAAVALTGCANVTGPRLECHQEIRGKLVGVLNHADGKADTLRADPKVWADTVTKCTPR